MRTLACALLLGASLSAQQESGDPKKPYEDLPGDVVRKRVETVTQGKHEYAIEFEGWIDGSMTRMPIGYGAYVQGWQPSRSVRIENTGETDVRNPRVVVNGRGNWHTMKSIVKEAMGRFTNPADRARSIYEFRRRTRELYDTELAALAEAK